MSSSENKATEWASLTILSRSRSLPPLTTGKSMSNKKTEDLPDFKDQCRSRSVVAGQYDPAARRRIVASAPRTPASNNEGPEDFKNQLRSVTWPDDNDEETPPAVETVIAEAIPFTDSQLRTVEPVRQTPPPLDATVVHRQHDEAIARAVRRYAVYLLLLIAVVAAVVVGGVCGAGKCSSSPTADRATAITAYINSITLTNKTIAYPPIRGSEEQALQWLIESDPLNLPASDKFRLQQRYALVDLWFSTTPYSVWKNSTGWLAAENECDWAGITCVKKALGDNGEMQSVVDQIRVPSNNIRGSIPADLGLLRNLTQVDFSWNSLSGPLPQSVGNFIVVKNFVTRGNALTGTLPESIGLFQNLVVFDLSCNFLSGSLPESIGQWSDLERFLVHNNTLNGTLPDSIGNWSKVEYFRVSENKLSGSLPELIGQMTALTTFFTYENAMTGTLPASIGQWSNLNEFAIYKNSYNGTLPDSIGNWSKVVYCDVSRNAFTGTIPKGVENWSNIQSAYFNGNSFTGSIPSGIYDAVNLTTLEADCSEVNCTHCTCH
jgi:hypothetical protein